MKSVYLRLITFFAGIPAIVCIVLFLPHKDYLALNTLIALFTVIGASETAKFFDNKGIVRHALLPVICSILFPVAAYLEIAGIIAPTVDYILLPLVLWIVLLGQLFRQGKLDIENVLARTGSDLVIAMYPGVLAAFVVRITSLDRPELAFLIFIVAVFANDSMAYVVGMLFGRSNRGVFPVSPMKSVAGLVAGLLSSIGSVLIFYSFFGDFFGGSLLLALCAGCGIGVATIAGDLVESALKRSAGVKDSGRVIPGRGGMLDSIDSVVFAAPVFFLLVRYFA